MTMPCSPESTLPTHAATELSYPVVVRQDLRLLFTRDVFAPENRVLADVLARRDQDGPSRVLVCWDEGLEGVRPDLPRQIVEGFQAWRHAVQLVAPPVRVPGGEAVKNDPAHLQVVWSAIEAARLCRHSFVVVIGGGAVLDMVGFAAATAHRGIPLVRLPTTSLSQADGGIGVKNSINFFGKKNWLGSFAVPHAVVNDADFLHLLPMRERRAGLAEAVKVSLIRDRSFFESIERQAASLGACEPVAFEEVVRTSARHHLEHIATGGDPFEKGSARPLDFGHWAAHKLEQITGFTVGHGEAVAIGLALDVMYASRIGLLPQATAERVLRVLETLGFRLHHPALATRNAAGAPVVLDGLEEFREHLGGRLTITMIREVGEAVDVHAIDGRAMAGALRDIEARDTRA